MTKYTVLNAATDVLTGNVAYASSEVAEKRFAICTVCPKMNKTMKVCKVCGCFLPGKIKFAKSECPEGKW